MFQRVLVTVGLITTTYITYRTYLALHLFLFHKSSLPKYIRPDTWALITGSSDGIGLAYAEELYSKGANIILHGRNRQKLEGVRQRLTKLHPSPDKQIRIWVFDATKRVESDAELDELVQPFAEGKQKLTILINNVAAWCHPGEKGVVALTEMNHQDVEVELNVNLNLTTHLTRVLLPVLARNSPALLINTGSIAWKGVPFVTVYGATKAYLRTLSKGLAQYMAHQKTDVEVIYTDIIGVSSKGSGVLPDMITPTPKAWVRSALGKVGSGNWYITPFFWHWLLSSIIDVLPESFVDQALTKAFIEKRDPKTWVYREQ